MTYHHGITPQELAQGVLPMRNPDVGTLGLIVTSEDADEDMYPYDTPVLFAGIKQENLDKTGTTGTLGKCLQDIRDEYNPTIIVLRLSDKDDVDSIDILRKCKSMLGRQPKVLVAPELDTPAIARKMLSYCQDRRAITYVSPRTDDGELITDITEIIAYREAFGAREIIIVDNKWGKNAGK